MRGRDGANHHRVRGAGLTTPEKIFEAYARLRTADKLSLAVVRQGKPMLLEYAIE